MYPLQRLIILYMLKNKNNSDLIVPCQTKGHRSASLTVAVNTRTVLATVPPQGCKAFWASGEIQKKSTSLLSRNKVAEPSARRLWDCYANQFFHPNVPTCHSGVFAFAILKGAGLNPNAFGVFSAIMSSVDRVRRVSAKFIIAVNTPKTTGLSPVLF